MVGAGGIRDAKSGVALRASGPEPRCTSLIILVTPGSPVPWLMSAALLGWWHWVQWLLEVSNGTAQFRWQLFPWEVCLDALVPADDLAFLCCFGLVFVQRSS